MVIKEYHVVLHSPLGPREGTLTLDEDRGEVAGTLYILSRALPVHGRRRMDGSLYLTHPIVTAVCEYPCQSALREAGDTLSGELRVDQSGAPWWGGKYQSKTVMSWSGERLKEMEATHK